MEQFDQLLTCAICLDRYRNPKLLPCQHSFCMEPCMEGLVNYVTRQVKCPECRAEHRIPYQGIQQYPTNVTLQRFLELHIEITGELPDPTSGQVMERCGVCSEKAYVTACSHCDKRVCPDCKEAHLDILRREIARVNNQVRRTLPRLNDALSVIEKNTVHLQTNCANIIEEIDDIYHRLSKALKDRTEFLKSEIEVFLAKELRHLTQLKENLDQEISNFDSNSDFAEKHMGEGAVWDDNELLDAKEIFLRTMEFIRSFECETGDYHRRVRFFIPQDPNQLATTLSTLGELTINASQSQAGSAPQPPQPPTLGPGLMRSKSDHRVAAQFRQAEERYMQTYGSEAGGGGDDGPRRYFGDRSNTRFGDSSRRGEYGDYDSDMPSTDTRRSSRFRSRFMRHLDSGDSDNEPTSRSVRFHDQQGSESGGQSGGPQKKERSRVIDTEDATRGPLSGITRFMDSPRVMKKLQEMEQKGKKKDRPSSLSLPSVTPTMPTANPVNSPLRRAARQVSEDEIDKIKKQNKSAEAAGTETPSAAAASVTSAAQRKTSSSSQPDTPTSTGSDRSRTAADRSVSRQNSAAEKRDESTDKRTTTSYSRSQSQNEGSTSSSSYRTEEPTRAPPPSIKPAPAPFSRTSSSSSVNQEDAERGSNSRSRVTDRFKPGRTSTSSESSTSAESSKHSSPVRNTGAAFSTDELRSRFGTARKSSNSPNGDSAPSTTTTSTTSSAPRSRFGTVTSATSSTPTGSRFGSNSSSSSSSTSTPAASSSTATTAVGTGPRFQSRFLGRAGTPTAEASKGSESSSSSEEDSSASESDSDDDNESAPVTSTSVSSTALTASATGSSTVRDRELARTDIGPLLARSAQARDSTSSYTSRSSALDPTSTTSSSAGSTSYRRTNPPSVAPPPPSYSSSSTLSRTPTSRFGSVSSSSDGPSSSRYSDYSAPSTGLSRSRTGSALHSTEDMENKYPLTSKYLNRSRANLSTDHSTSSTSTSDTSSTYTPRYGGYRSRFLNKSKSSAALAPDREDDEDDAGSESPSQDGSNQELPSSEAPQSAAASSASPLVAGEERYPSGRSRYAALKDRRSRLARSKSSHDVAPTANGLDNSAEANNSAAGHKSGEVADTGTSPQTTNVSQERAAESGSETGGTGSSLSNWARYLKNKYGPRNKDNATDSSDAESGTQGRALRKKSIINRPWSPEAHDSNKSEQIVLSPVSPTTLANFSFNHYMQKRKVQIKFGTRGSEAGCFTWPRGVAVGPDNNVVVADSSNHRVQVLDVKGRFVKEFGHYGNGEGEFDCLAGVAVNRIGQYIIADRYNHRIQVFDPSGRFLRVFGSQGSADGKFSYPWGVTTDALGFIYVCDKENHRVQVFQSDGTFVGKFGSLGNRPGQLEHPHYIAVSCTNRVIVSDSNNHRIQVFDVNGKVLTSFGQEGADDGHFKFPRGVAVDDQGYIIVADSGNNRIQIFSPDGVFIRSFGGWGSGDGEFKGLEGIAVLSNGNIVVCDRENHRIQIF